MTPSDIFVFCFRFGVFAVICSIVVTIILYTPFPNQSSYANCNRPCHELDWPMICRFQLVIEARRSLNSKSCGDCPRNTSDCLKKYCLTGDGSQRQIITANKLYPGPSMHVCENDILLVEVINRLAGHSVTLHWRGQPLQETPSMDGVPMVTQCPVATYTTFQYKLRASQAGTHLWQAMSGDSQVDELFGGLVVRRSKKQEPQLIHYDIDDPSHLILLSEWTSESGKSFILVNGRSNENVENLVFPLPNFNVTKGKRYRFRVAYATSNNGCPLMGHFSAHGMLVLALDGHSIEPQPADFFKIVPGERIDFVINANQAIDKYWIQFSLVEWCAHLDVKSYAVLSYNGSSSPQPTRQSRGTVNSLVLTTISEENCDEGQKICLSKMRALQKLPENLVEKSDVQLKFILNKPTVLTETDVNDDEDGDSKQTLNFFSFTFPSSPLLTQYDDIPDVENMVCNKQRRALRCSSEYSASCHCIHIVYVPLKSTVEINIANPGDDQRKANNIFHLHGQNFFVIRRDSLAPKISVAEKKVKENENEKDVSQADSQQQHPVLKDTISVPNNSFVVLRFIGNNPGYWLLHEERPDLWSKGMAVVLKVGEHSDFPHVPENFPKCGSWIGPEFFLA